MVVLHGRHATPRPIEAGVRDFCCWLPGQRDNRKALKAFVSVSRIGTPTDGRTRFRERPCDCPQRHHPGHEPQDGPHAKEHETGFHVAVEPCPYNWGGGHFQGDRGHPRCPLDRHGEDRRSFLNLCFHHAIRLYALQGPVDDPRSDGFAPRNGSAVTGLARPRWGVKPRGVRGSGRSVVKPDAYWARGGPSRRSSEPVRLLVASALAGPPFFRGNPKQRTN